MLFRKSNLESWLSLGIDRTLIFVFLLLSFAVFSNKKDSLLNCIKIQKDDTGKVISYNSIITLYLNNQQLDSARFYANKSITLSQKINFNKGLTFGYQKLGIIDYYETNFIKAIENLNQSLVYAKRSNDISGIIACYSNLGIIYHSQDNFPKALECGLMALKIREENKDIKGLAASYNNLGLIYKDQKDYKKALDYYFKAKRINEDVHDSSRLSNSYNNIGIVYDLLKDYRKSLDFHFKALAISKNLDNHEEDVAMSYNNIGMVYLNQDMLLEALNFFMNSLKISRVIDDKEVMSDVFINISTVFNKNKNYSTAIKYSDSTLLIAKEFELTENIRLAYENLASSYAMINDFEKAYKYEVLFKQVTDSIFNENNSKLLSDLKTNFEVEKKEIELNAKSIVEKQKLEEISTLDRQRRNFVIIAVIIILFVVSFFSFSLYKRLHLINRQKKIIEAQRNQVEEKHKEITDSINYAERIQRSLLASKKMLDDNLNDYFVLFKPKDIVSGDFYWSTVLSNSNFVLVTADSTGHGVPGAIMSIVNIASLKEAIVQGIESPDLILNETRRLVIENLKNDGSIEGGKDGMDASLISIDFKNKKMTCACANNPI